ncbi:Metallo-dependent hydrolase [Melanogaster broomeanus]|nr:Metallo-dependent hydrolase [Melanogaster broomeanus]
MVAYSILDKAYVKIFLHAAKHPHKPVNGVLLGKLSSGVVIIQDVIPLLHHWTSLSPMMEIGLDLAKGHAESVDLSLVGYYQACERIDDTALAPVGERVAGQLRSQFSDAIAFVIDGDSLGSGEAALIPYLPLSGSTSWRPQSLNPPAFAPGSQITLVDPTSPSRAVALVRDDHMHRKFGDFDDHLEDVTIDWLSNSASALATLAVRGTLVHCPALGQVEILKDHLLCMIDPRVLADGDPPPGSFLLPTFCDLHLHAPQFMYQGTGLDLPLMEWLDKYAYKAEESLDEKLDLAKKVYRRLAQRLTEVGTGAVLLFGTIKTETNLVLAQEMQDAGVRAFVGKLSMDKSSRPTYKESSADSSLRSAEDFIHRCKASVAEVIEHQRLIEPVITPRFVPTCSDELLEKLGELSQRTSTRVQSHLAESYEEAKWVKDERGIDDIKVFKKTAVAHCPLSNAYFSERPFPLREALDKGVLVGLGTDVAGGYSIDIMNSMRQAVAVSRMREGLRAVESKSTSTDGGQARSLAVEWKESLFLSTRVGASFDAQQIYLFDSESSTGVGALDFFDLESECKEITMDMIEKWWCMGDIRNRTGMWVQGRKLI